MPKYRIGMHPFCPIHNVVVKGTNFPYGEGGIEVELHPQDLAEIKADIATKEVRFFADHRAGILPKGQGRKDGKPGAEIVKGPPCRKAVALGEMLWIKKVEAPKASKPAQKVK